MYQQEVIVCYQVFKTTKGLRVYFDFRDDQDTLLFRSFHDDDSDTIPDVEAGKYVSKAIIPANLLGPLKYVLQIRAGIHNVRSCLPPSGIPIPIHVVMTGQYNRGYLNDTFRGKLGLSLDWNTERVN